MPTNGELKELFGYIDAGRRLSIFGMNGAHKLHVVSQISSPVFYVASDVLEARKITEALECFGKRALRFPEKEDGLFFRKSSMEGAFGRIGALFAVLENDFDVIVATPESIMAYTPEREKFANCIVVLEEGKTLSIEEFTLRLFEMGYSKADYADAKGTFACRGDIVDVFPPTEERPYRIEFFGDEIERIHFFEEKENLPKLTLLPVTDLIFTQKEKGNLIRE